MAGKSRLLRGGLVVILFIPAAIGQAGPAEVQSDLVLVHDPAGDVRFEDGSTAPQEFDHVDFLRLWVSNETPTTFEAGFEVARWNYAQPYTYDPIYLAPTFVRAVFFTFGGVEYAVTAPREVSLPATLSARDPDTGRLVRIAEVDAVVNPDENTFHVTVPKSLVRDGKDAPLRYGDTLDGIYAYAYHWAVYVRDDVLVYDRVPDDGSAGPFNIRLGTQVFGDFQVSSPQPIRVSNGEATTFVYQVVLDNFGDSEETFLLELTDLLPSFQGRVPSKVTVPAQSHREVPVILSMAFTHEHGAVATFFLQVQSASAAQVATSLPLGVQWTEIPQPAGHHPILYLHSSAASNDVFGDRLRSLWMNPLREDPRPGTDDGPADLNSGAWRLPLSPALAIGIDLDTEQEGYFVGELGGAAAYQSARLEASVEYCRPGEGSGVGAGQDGCVGGSWFPVASGVSDAQGLPFNQRREFVVPLKVEPWADLIPYARGANLRLLLQPLFDSPPDLFVRSTQLFVDTSELFLPFVEYHDPVDQAFERVGSLQLSPLSAFEKPVNPGKVAVFSFELANQAQEPRQIVLSLEGHNKAWARWNHEGSVELRGGETREVFLAVEPPSYSSPGERAELFALAEDAKDPSVVALSRLRAVVTLVDVPDERDAFLSDDTKMSVPFPTGLAVAAALLMTVICRRKARWP